MREHRRFEVSSNSFALTNIDEVGFEFGIFKCSHFSMPSRDVSTKWMMSAFCSLMSTNTSMKCGANPAQFNGAIFTLSFLVKVFHGVGYSLYDFLDA